MMESSGNNRGGREMNTIFGYLGKSSLFTHVIDKDDDILHNHSFVEVFYITQGSASHLCNGKTTKLIKGTIFFLRPFDQHMYIRAPGETCAHRDILIATKRFREICSIIDEDLFPLFMKGNQPLSFQLSSEEFMNLEQELSDYETSPQIMITGRVFPKESLLISKIVNLYADQLIAKKHDIPIWLSSLLDKMNNPNNFYCSLHELLDDGEVFYEKAYLSRIFKKNIGCSMITYFTNAKLNYAVSLLRFTNTPIATVATQAGFANVTYFNKQFKKVLGTSPKKYRELVSEKTPALPIKRFNK